MPARRAEEGDEAGRDHDLALDARAPTRTTLQTLTDQFNSSQTDVKVKLVNQIGYEENFAKYRAGLGGGDLPDVVQVEDTDRSR